MRERGKAEAAVLLGDDHAEEALVLDELPRVRRQIVQFVRDLPVVQHRAQFLDRAVDESLFLGAERRLGKREQLVPVGLAAEQIAVPPHRAGIERFLLGLRHLRQDFAEQREQRRAKHSAAQRRTPRLRRI